MCFCLCLALGAAAPARRHLALSLYPYIPARYEAALRLKQDFEAAHPDVVLDVRFNDSYYSLNPKDGGVLYEDADIHEIDSALLDTFLQRRRLAPLGLDDLNGGFDPAALPAGMRHGELVAAPHWLCADFLFYRADEPALDGARRLDEVARGLAPGQGLLMDLAGEETLAEILLDMRLGAAVDADRLADAPSAAEVARVSRMLALEPAGFGRDRDYDLRGTFYARQFARRAGGAYVGYSETLNAVLDETAQSCTHAQRCVQAGDVRVTRFPFADAGRPPGLWVDVFAIDARVHGAALRDARDFIRFAVSLPAYRALLVPLAGEAPRYLLPASKAAYADPAILGAAPLYPRFHALIQGGPVLQGDALGAALRASAGRLGALLPALH